MKDYFYAVYDLKNEKEMCIGVWDSMAALCGKMGIEVEAGYRNLYQTLAGRKFSRTKIAVYRIFLD